MIRKSRDLHELLQDTRFSFHLGQLIGAAEMAAHWMRLQEDPKTKDIGEKLGEVTKWFFTEGNGQSSRSSRPS